MRAVQVTRFGTPDVLQVAEVHQPVPAPGEVLVRVAGTTFNAVDAAIRSGVMTELIPVQLPYTPGLEVAGTVVVDGAETDEHVVAFLGVPVGGGAAEFAAVPRDLLVPAPGRSRWPTRPSCRSPASPRSRACSTTAACRPGNASWSTARAAVSAASPCSWPSAPVPT